MISKPRFDIGQLVQDHKGFSHIVIEREYTGHQYDRDWHYILFTSSPTGSRFSSPISEYELYLTIKK